MKKLIRLMVIGLLLLPPAGLSAEGEVWDSLYTPKDISVSAGVGFLAFSQSGGLAAYPGVEIILKEFIISEMVPLEVGAAVRGFFNLFNESSAGLDYGWLAFGGGAFGTVHFTLRGSDLNIAAFFEKLDFYSAMGLAFTYFSYTGDWGTRSKYADTGLGFASSGGISYFLRDNLALFLEGSYWGYGGGATVGALLKL
jgi:hypothetical protein